MMKEHLSGVTALIGEEEASRPMRAVLKSYGLQGKYTTDPAEQRRLVATLDDVEGFIHEMLVAYKATGDPAYPPLVGTAGLEDLAIDDATTRGVIVQTRSGTTQRDNVTFEMEDGAWRMNFLYIPAVE
jgi:hypothetical protein